ncbi:hypothetical protein LMG27952_06143 [Paraburkholderia hiiakae]|uniref:GH16 domain-containing protein n=2 Tax=Paraburkholderia hiiakae TaxID=1081782 RepID=A0ABN7IBA6_9BURK|nr:hypothetical protein LMG27952_06143 [Paraburkholderia hiiakae]
MLRHYFVRSTNKLFDRGHVRYAAYPHILLRAMLAVLSPLLCLWPACAMPAGAWELAYRDNYAYSAQDPADTTFNTWFWREDASATHVFNITDIDGCTVDKPCVRLTAKATASPAPYTNAEMYNNSCIKDSGAGLSKSAWGQALGLQIDYNCAQPYPYRKPLSPAPFPGVHSSWATPSAPVYLEPNLLTFSVFDTESPWKTIRDVAFNNPWQAGPHNNVRLTTEIKAENEHQGGSRGWGFWNTTMDPLTIQLAWFMEYSVPGNPAASRVLLQTVTPLSSKDGLMVCETTLANPGSIYAWHTYRIEWLASVVRYYVDDVQVAEHQAVLSRHMAFHNWVDNRNYGPEQNGLSNFPLTGDKSNVIRSFVVEHQPTVNKADVSGKKWAGDAMCRTVSKGALEKEKFQSPRDIIQFMVQK